MANTNGHVPRIAILYARVSTDEQARSGYSLAQQIEALRDYAAREGYQVLEEVVDPGQSGASLERPGMDRVRDLVAAGGASVVLAQDRDRFAREPAYHYLLRREFEERGVKIRALNDRGDESPEGELTDGILDQLAKYERAKIAERSRRGKLRKAREGKVIGAHRPRYGFKLNEARDGYEVDEEKMRLVRRVFQLVAQGDSLRSIALTLDRERVPTPKEAKYWDRAFFRACVLDDVYKPHRFEEVSEVVSPEVASRLDPAKPYGLWWFNRVEMKSKQVSEITDGGRRYTKKYSSRLRPKEEWIAVPVACSGVSRELVEAARAQLIDNHVPSSAGHRVWVLSGGIGRCAVCRRVLRSRRRVKNQNGRRYIYYYYRCSGYDTHGLEACKNSRYTSATKLEKQVWEFVRALLLNPEELRSDLDRAIDMERDEVRGDPDAEARHWLDKLSEVDEERRGFLRLSARGRITDAELDEEIAGLEETRKIAESELEATRGRQQRVDQMKADRDAVLEHYAALAPEKLDTLTAEECHQLYKILRLKVLVGKNGDLGIELDAVPTGGDDGNGNSGSSIVKGMYL